MKRLNSFNYDINALVNGNVTLDQSHLIMSNSRVHIESESSSLSSFIADISSSDFHVVDTYLLVNTGNINLSGSLVDWKENSNVSLSGGTLIIMGNSAKWQITKSQMNLTSVLFNISNDSQLEINNCAFTVGGSERISFVLEHNSTLTINSGNTNALKCKITKSIVIPENARFTEADVSGLNCIKTARDTIALLDRDFDINNKREEKPVKPIFLNKPLHYDSCPIGGTPITQRNTVTPTTTTTATPPPTVTTSFANYMAGSIVVIIMSLLV